MAAKPPLKPDDAKVWGLVAATVRENLGREAPLDPDAPTPKTTVAKLNKARLGKRAPKPAPAAPVEDAPPVAPEWLAVASKVKPLKGRAAPVRRPAARTATAAAPLLLAAEDLKALQTAQRPTPQTPPDGIEPGRKRRIVRERQVLDGRLDLHGFDQDQARPALEGFIRRSFDAGHRAVLIITGKGKLGTGVLRRYAPEWLAAPHLRDMVAGVSAADRRHGGDGALYVALKRRG